MTQAMTSVGAPWWRRPADGRASTVLAGGFLILALALALPGQVPYDGIVVWYEAETHRLYAQHPAALVLIWRLSEGVVKGPALFTGLQLATLWLAIGLLIARYRPPIWAGVVFGLVLLLWPPLLAQAGLTVKDVFGAHLALLAFAVATEKRFADWRWFAAFAVGTLAFLLRYQFGLILPVLALVWWPLRTTRSAAIGLAGIAVALVVVNAAVAALFVKTGPGDVSQSLRKMAIFDIAGIVARDPSAPLAVFAGAGVDVTHLKRDMAQEYSPVRVDTLWQVNGSGSTITPTSGVFGRLYTVPDPIVLRQWLGAVVARPGAFLAHRWAAFARVLGLGDVWQCRPVLPGISWLPRGPAAAVHAQSFAPAWSTGLMRSRFFPVSLTFRAVVYVVLLIVLLVVGGRDAGLLAGFALAYELSFLLLPQACEVRYSYLAILVAAVAGGMVLSRRIV